MVNVAQYQFRHEEVVTALVKHQGIHDGLWQLTLGFGLAAANVNAPDQNGNATLSPAAITIVTSIGLSRVDAEGPLAVDAAKVNPLPSRPKKRAKKVPT